MQILGKFIADNAVTAAKIRLPNAQWLRARNAADTADVNIVRVNAVDAIEFSSLPLAAGTPASPTELVNFGFLRTFIDGARDPKNACRVASVGNVVLVPAPAAIDGVTLATNDRVLLLAQTLPAENGIYIFDGTDLVRSSDADESFEVTQGMSTMVIEGTANGNTQWVLTTVDPIVLGTTALSFAQIPTPGSIVGGDMIVASGSNISVDLAAVSGLESTNPGNVAGQLRIKLVTAGPVKDQTLAFSGSNELTGLKDRKVSFTLIAADITNQYVDLPSIAHESSIMVQPVGGLPQEEAVDYTLNYTGGAGGFTRISFAGDLATGGGAELVAGDKLLVHYKNL